MKIEELFKKAEKFFSIDKEKRDKKEKLESLVEKKISSIKDKIKDADSKKKKEELEKKLEILIDLQKKM